MLWGRRVWQRETMVSTAAAGSSRRRKKKSPAASFFSTGQAPWSTARAPRMMAEAAACRKISVRRTVGRQWERSRSDRTFPGLDAGQPTGVPHQHQPAPTGQGRETAPARAPGPPWRPRPRSRRRCPAAPARCGRRSGRRWSAVIAGLQQPVDGGGLRPAGFPTAALPPARWGRSEPSAGPGGQTALRSPAGRWSCRCPVRR